jgi:hypothetical protein
MGKGWFAADDANLTLARRSRTSATLLAGDDQVGVGPED